MLMILSVVFLFRYVASFIIFMYIFNFICSLVIIENEGLPATIIPNSG